MTGAIFQLTCFILAALISMPLAFFAWMNTGFCGISGLCLLADLPILLPAAVLLCFASIRWGRALAWVTTVLALFTLYGSRIAPFILITPVLLQLGNYRPFLNRATS
jgi:hypothetical protein